jgi:GNAT superfamily N-acetyltransferase
MGEFSQIARLESGDDVAPFDCGEVELNEFLKRHARAGNVSNSAVTFVVKEGGCVVGYYTLAAGGVDRRDAPLRVAKGLGGYPVPIVLLARLAVDARAQGKGLGSALLKDAMIRAARVGAEIGVRALVVHAKHEKARAYYAHFNFEPSPTHPLHLFLLMKDLRSYLEGIGYLQR